MASYNSKFITGDKLKPIIQDVYVEINKTSTNASIEITNALNTAKTYAENKSTEALNSAKSYADNVGSTTLSSAKSYADNVGSNTLTAAKKYTDDEVSAALDTSTEYTNDEVAKSLASAKEYADGVGSSTLNSAKAYTDNVGSNTLSSAKSYADNVGSNTLSSAKSYADTSIENLVDNAPTDANTLKKLNDRINTNVQSISDLSNVVDTKATDADLTAHKNDKSNPHSVTKAQVGLGNADNTADAVKDVRSATKLATTHSIFGQDFDGTADVSGQATVDGIYQSDNTKRYLRSAIQIRENGLVGNSQSDIGYGPAIGFNWVGHNGGTLVMGTNGTFYLKTKDWTRATLDANIVGNLTGNITGDVTGDITGDIKGNVTGNLTGTATNATNDSLGQKIDTTYIKGLSVSGRVITYTRGDDTIGTITTQDTTYPVFTGATSSTAGTTGLVPAPGSGDNLKFLRADGKWIVPTDTNTWRPIEDVLTSTSTVNSLTANQGRVLKELVDANAKTAKEYTDSNVNTLLGGASTDSNTLKKLEDKITNLSNSSATDADLTAHINDKNNPHKVTKAQVGLGNADNTADANKNVLSATKWTTARTLTLSGAITGSVNIDGSGNVTMTTSEGDVSFKRMGTTIDASTDWNTVTTPGAYTVRMSDWGDASTNHSPNVGVAHVFQFGLLTVFRSAHNAYPSLTQIYFPHSNNLDYCHVMVRQTHNGTDWSGWRPIYAGITKSYIGLGNVDNTADANKNVLSATKLTTARSIFGRTFDGTANVEGKATVYGHYVEAASQFYNNGGLEIRECDLVTNTKSDINYAPRLAFHWGQITAGTMIFHHDGNFYLRKIDGTSRATLDANIIGNVTGNLTGNVTGNITGDVTGNASSATYASNVRITPTAPSSATTYYIPFTDGCASNTNYLLRGNDGLTYYSLQGTTSTSGKSMLVLGNSIASGTAGNKYGILRLYSDTAYSSQIVPSAGITANRTVYLPNASGTVALTSDLNSYLPLAGGNMTPGALISFSSSSDSQSRNLRINHNGLYLKVDTGGWATGITWNKSDNSELSGIGAFGSGDSLGYMFIGGTYSDPYLKVLSDRSVVATKFVGALEGNATSADKATKDSADQTITSTYIKALSISGRTITYTKGNGTTGTITTQDTTYSAATSSAAGLMPAADKAKLDTIGDIITITKTLTITTEWQDTGISGVNLESGSYIIQVSGMNSAATSLWNERFTGFMSWFSDYTDDADNIADEIILHKAGHSSRANNIYLRTIRQDDPGDGTRRYLKLQISASGNFSETSVTFKFRKLI